MTNTHTQLNTRVTSDIAFFTQYPTPKNGNSAGIVGSSRCVMRI